MYLLKDIATVGLVTLSLAMLGMSRGRNSWWRRPLTAILAAFAMFKAFDLVAVAVGAIRHPPLWDFSVFWMVGRIAVAHHNVYDSAAYQMYRSILNPTGDEEFNTIALNIGLPYPPPAILMLYPLGLLGNISTALTAWYIAIFSAMVASIVLLWHRFFAVDGGTGLVVAAILVFSLWPTHLTIELAQLNFFVLLLLLQFWSERSAWRAGSWLAPLIVLRPLCVLLAMYFVVRRQWKALGALVVASAALLAISIPIVGWDAFASYLHRNPAQRYPEIYFDGSQSLYGLLVKFSHHHAGYFSLAAHPLFDVIAGVAIVAAAFICAISVKQQRDACLGLLLALALFLYPNTGTHYCGLLLVPLCAIWRDRERLALPSNVVVFVFALQYLLLNIRGGTSTTGLALVLDCAFFGFIALRQTTTPSAMLELRPKSSTFAARGT